MNSNVRGSGAEAAVDNKMSERQTKTGKQEFQGLDVIENSEKLEKRSLDMLNNFCFHVYAQKSHSHSLTFSFSHSLAHSPTLSKFAILLSLSRHAKQLLFSCRCSKVTVYSRKLQCFFFTTAPSPVSLGVIELVPN